MGLLLGALLSIGAAARSLAQSSKPNAALNAPVSLKETVSPSAVADAAAGAVIIRGTTTDPGSSRVQIRVLTSRGDETQLEVPVTGGRFECRYPSDFTGAPTLAPGALFIDATAGQSFDPSAPGAFQAEAALLVYDSRSRRAPDLPSAFTNDLLDRHVRVDSASSEWPVIRKLVNAYMHSRAAHLTRRGRQDFDLANDRDLRFFKEGLTLYEFDFRDRDWSVPLGRRVKRTFWQAEWDRWFTVGNDHPLDGNERNKDPSNYLPYAFTNDHADLLLTYLMRPRGEASLDDNLEEICAEGVANLLAMQHRESSNFAKQDSAGRQHVYTAGAFRYGMFENGEYLVEGTGWFYNPKHSDYVKGGVFNGRATWALGVALQRDPNGPLAAEIREAIAASVGFCLKDAQASGYTKRTRQGNFYWRDVGEHAYLMTGMLAACSVAPELAVPNPRGTGTIPLRDACAMGLDALVDLEKPHHQWSVFPNVDSVAIVALADGADVLRGHPDASKWIATATAVADAWIASHVDPQEYKRPVVNFGPRIEPDRMTYNWRRLSPNSPDHNRVQFYMTGHWIQALARLHAVTGKPGYRDRCDAMIGYLCGNNPWHVRLLNELGGVYNSVDDLDGDGTEDALKYDLYPESTAFCQVGIMHLLNQLARGSSDAR